MGRTDWAATAAKLKSSPPSTTEDDEGNEEGQNSTPCLVDGQASVLSFQHPERKLAVNKLPSGEQATALQGKGEQPLLEAAPHARARGRDGNIGFIHYSKATTTLYAMQLDGFLSSGPTFLLLASRQARLFDRVWPSSYACFSWSRTPCSKRDAKRQ